MDYAMDGCNVLAGSMPLGPVAGYNEGKTAVHEVGHWFGLLHTFQNFTCKPGDLGDYIDDTPQESVSTDGCPTGKDSCPDSPGLDPIHNYMDYSEDTWYASRCVIGNMYIRIDLWLCSYVGFTPDQIVRMQRMYSSLRLGF